MKKRKNSIIINYLIIYSIYLYKTKSVCVIRNSFFKFLLSFFLLGNSGNHELSYHMSPSQMSVEDDVSMDSTNTGTGELTDAVATARDKVIIAKAMDTMARVQCLSNNELPLPVEENVIDFDGPVLQDQHVPFNLQIPTSHVPPYFSLHYICEIGSRLLFLSIFWARSIPVFQCLK